MLVASDVASRGLDIRGLPYVVNYDFPSNLETYIHRVGRTGRLAAAGHAFSFFTRPMVRTGEERGLWGGLFLGGGGEGYWWGGLISARGRCFKAWVA